MSKAPDTTTTNTTTQLPGYVEPYYKDLLARSQAASNTPYQPYGNQRIADFSADTQSAFQDVRDRSAEGTPAWLTNAQNTAATGQGYQAGNITTQGIPDMDVSRYMNPNTEAVLDVEKRRALQNFQEQQASRNTSAINAGAFGGDRRFVQDSLAQRDLNNQLTDINATGLNRAYDTATSLYQQDQGRNLQGQMANEDARRMGATFGLDAAKFGGVSGQMGEDLRTSRNTALSEVGAKEQQRAQAGLDMAYGDFNRQTQYPNSQLSTYSQLLQGLPVGQNTSSSVTGPTPDFLSGLIGAGTAAAGVAQLWPLLFA